MGRIQKAGSEDGMFTRQSTEPPTKKEGLMWDNNRMKGWENRPWSDTFGPNVSGSSILSKERVS